ncbi:MAG: hypothetical protein Q8P90_01290 [bacterium]|nr:hypothetical protein [bacterium]
MKEKGSIIIVVVVFGSVLLMSIGALVSLFLVQHNAIQRSIASERSFQIAEAGINRYRWFLSHNPSDDSGLDTDYVDPIDGSVGHYTVDIDPPAPGSTILEMTATGWTNDYPNLKRSIKVNFGKPSFTEFAFLSNSSAWFNAGEEVDGKVHSNGGIRIDGNVQSRVTTIKETYICGPNHGCDNEEHPGIWGTGQDPTLWDFPVADGIDFDAIALDYYGIKAEANTDGVLLTASDSFGYHIIFNLDGTFSVYEVTSLRNPVWGHDGINWTYESNSINSEELILEYENVPIPSNGLIFVEDQTWVSGKVNGRATVVAANTDTTSSETYDIIIPQNIEYYPDNTSGSVLGLMAQEDILVPLYIGSDGLGPSGECTIEKVLICHQPGTSAEASLCVPSQAIQVEGHLVHGDYQGACVEGTGGSGEFSEDLVIEAAMLAQNGHVFRYYYYPPYYPQDTLHNLIRVYGTIITNKPWTWTWVNDEFVVTSGFINSEITYDSNLYFNPPPFFPSQEEYEFISWEEVDPT